MALSEYESRKRAREDLARVIYDQEQREGKRPNYSDCERYANERADICDKKRDWKVKE